MAQVDTNARNLRFISIVKCITHTVAGVCCMQGPSSIIPAVWKAGGELG